MPILPIFTFLNEEKVVYLMVFYSPRVFTQVILHIFRQENWVTLRGPPDGVTQLLFSSIPPVFVLDGPLPCSQELTASYCSDEGDFS